MRNLTDQEILDRTVAAASNRYVVFDAEATLGLQGLSDDEKIAAYKRAAAVIQAQFDRRGRKA